MHTKSLFILKQARNWKLQVFLSMYDLLVDSRRLRVKIDIPILLELLNWSTV